MTDAGYGIPEALESLTLAPTGEPLVAGTSFTKDTFENILKEHGVWMVYVRGLRDFPCVRCRAGNRQPGEGDGDCPVCLGLGYKAKLERVLAFLSRGRRTMPQEADIIPGMMGNSMFRVFFSIKDKPQSEDLLLEVEWSTPKNRIRYAGEPTRILHVYALEQVEPFYFGGEPLFATTTLDPFDHHLDPIKKAIAERRS